MAACQIRYEFTGLDGQIFGIDTFGASGNGNVVMDHFGFSAEQILNKLNLTTLKA